MSTCDSAEGWSVDGVSTFEVVFHGLSSWLACRVLLVAGRLGAFRFAGSWLRLPCLVCFWVSLASFCWQLAGCSLLDCLLDLLWVCISSLAVVLAIL